MPTVLHDQYLLIPNGTTAQRPASPTTGMLRYNTELLQSEVYHNDIWRPLENVFSATGGTTTIVSGKKIHTFTSSGTFTANGAPGTLAEVLVVAGGGGTGNRMYHNGGGGAGGLVYGTNITCPTGSYTITVGGGGGTGDGTSTPGPGSNGANSVFGSFATALGGGYGGTYPSVPGNPGGSGGGGAANGQPSVAAWPGGSAQQTSPSGFTGYGNAGGTTISQNSVGSGGGGAGGAGAGNNTVPGNYGGIGRAYSISGTSVYYAGGGGGSLFNGSEAAQPNATAGPGGQGGGGAGATGLAQNGSENTGGGAGGSERAQGQGPGASGGSGVVIISYTI